MRYIALYLCAALGVVYLLQLSTGITNALILEKDTVGTQPWRLVTSMFAHGSTFHLLSNVVALALFGLLLEQVVGWQRFLLIYGASGLVAGMAAALLYPASLGASGAVFGIIGALATLRPRMTVFALGVPMPMVLAAATWAVLDVGGLFYPSDVANAAHLGGLAAGIVFGMAYRAEHPEKKRRKTPSVIPDRELDDWEERYMGL